MGGEVIYSCERLSFYWIKESEIVQGVYEDVTLLLEVEEQTAYKLMVIAKPFVLKMLADQLPIILREPAEEEKTFLKQKLSKEERMELEQYEPHEQMMNLEVSWNFSMYDRFTYYGHGLKRAFKTAPYAKNAYDYWIEG